MRLRELAEAFRVNIGELTSISGYSRQGLYNVIENNKPINKVRFNALINHLELYSNAIYEQDIEQAKEEKYKRDELIRKIKERGGENERFR